MTLALPPGHQALILDEIDSTNEEARRQAGQGVRGPLWIMARRQTACRGRRGRQWESMEGNLLTTLLIDPQCVGEEAARLSFVAALSARDLIAHYAPDRHIGLKWPNDVLLQSRKCAGILLEAGASEPGPVHWLAVGIGVNLAFAPQIEGRPTASLADYGPAPDPLLALQDLAASWDHWWQRWRRDGFAPIRQSWLAHAEGIGNEITARLPEEISTGRFEGLDEGGRLQLRTADGSLRTIASGEVFFAPQMS